MPTYGTKKTLEMVDSVLHSSKHITKDRQLFHKARRAWQRSNCKKFQADPEYWEGFSDTEFRSEVPLSRFKYAKSARRGADKVSALYSWADARFKHNPTKLKAVLPKNVLGLHALSHVAGRKGFEELEPRRSPIPYYPPTKTFDPVALFDRIAADPVYSKFISYFNSLVREVWGKIEREIHTLENMVVVADPLRYPDTSIRSIVEENMRHTHRARIENMRKFRASIPLLNRNTVSRIAVEYGPYFYIPDVKTTVLSPYRLGIVYCTFNMYAKTGTISIPEWRPGL